MPELKSVLFSAFQRAYRLVEHLRQCGIEVLISWPKPMHHQQALGLMHFHLPETEKISQEVEHRW